MLEVKNLNKYYGSGKNKILACNDISFKLNTGEITSLLGLNGAGKSTLINCISAFHKPSSGNIIIDGVSVLDNEIEAKKRMGILYEQNPLYSMMTVHEFLFFCAGMHIIEKDKIHERVNEMIEFWELEEYANRSIKNLSKGYKQRLGIAQALLHNPPFLILDEPSSGLDAMQIISMEKKLLQIAKEKTILISTHNLKQAAQVCNNHILINKGSIIAQGKIYEIKKQLEDSNCEFENSNAEAILEKAFIFFAGVNKNEFRKIETK